MNKIVRVIFNADLRCSHTGLRVVADELDIQLDELRNGEVVVFVNAKKNQLKLFGPMNSIVHFKNKDDSKIDLRVLAQIPRFFNGKEFNYSKALKTTFTEGGLK